MAESEGGSAEIAYLRRKYTEALARVEALTEENRRLKELIDYDPLIPSVMSRRGILRVIGPIMDHIAHAPEQDRREYALPIHTVSIAVVDLDNLKKINDEAGHLAGDEVLMVLGGLIRKEIRATDHVARMGGDEFLIALMNTSKDAASALMAKVAERFARHEFEFTVSVPHGISYGVACTGEFHDQDTLVAAADRRMLEEKRKKRVGR